MNKLYGFDFGDNYFIGRLVRVVKSSVNPMFDLAYIESFDGVMAIGFVSELKTKEEYNEFN